GVSGRRGFLHRQGYRQCWLLAGSRLARSNRPLPLHHACSSALEVVWMVVTIDIHQHLRAHAEIARRLPQGDAVLHRPGHTGVAKGMRNHLRIQTTFCDESAERLADVVDLPAVELDYEGLTSPVPAPK